MRLSDEDILVLDLYNFIRNKALGKEFRDYIRKSHSLNDRQVDEYIEILKEYYDKLED
jgi:hypothetical protein